MDAYLILVVFEWALQREGIVHIFRCYRVNRKNAPASQIQSLIKFGFGNLPLVVVLVTLEHLQALMDVSPSFVIPIFIGADFMRPQDPEAFRF